MYSKSHFGQVLVVLEDLLAYLIFLSYFKKKCVYSLWCDSAFNQIDWGGTLGSDLFKVFVPSLGSSKISIKSEPGPSGFNTTWLVD